MEIRFDFSSTTVANSIASTIRKEFHQNGTTNVPIFKWWFTTPPDNGLSVADIAREEYDVYLHHQREINGISNFGWLRNMTHSIAQQLMRMDPQYYRLYCSCRPDKAWRLISFPYYGKYAKPGDSTWFRHIDVNIPRLLKDNRAAHMIQGSVSLDEENAQNCTILVKGFHQNIADWWKELG